MAENDSSVFSRDLLSMFYGLLAALGVAFYFGWSLLYGTWTDMGVYAVTVVLVGFGVVGYLLYSIED